MSHSQRLTLAGMRDVSRLLGEVREQGADPVVWRTHAVRGLGALIGATVGISVEVRRWESSRQADIAVLVDLGWRGETEQRNFRAFVSGPEFASDPFITKRNQIGHEDFTVLRPQIIEDRTWYAAPTVVEGRRFSDIDHPLNSSRTLPDGGDDELAFHRPWNAKSFSARERRIVSYFHDELAHLWRLKASRPPGVLDALPPYLRSTLNQLLSGASEKEAAHAVGISRHTLHGYAKQLYQRLAVSSRPELMAKCLPQYDFVPRLASPSRSRPRES